MEAEEPETKKSKTKTNNNVFTNNKSKGCRRCHMQNAKMGWASHVWHKVNTPVKLDNKSACNVGCISELNCIFIQLTPLLGYNKYTFNTYQPK